jgi:hypothetical protein
MAPQPNEAPVVVIGDPSLADAPPPSNQATANKAKGLLCIAEEAFRDPSAPERSALAAAFAAKNFVVYGKAFDLVEVHESGLALADPFALAGAIDRKTIALIEVKSTSADRDEHFRGHFFSMSTAELLVAQSLGALFKFAFVNTTTENFRLVTLQDILKRAKAIYPTWSIRFDDQEFQQP